MNKMNLQDAWNWAITRQKHETAVDPGRGVTQGLWESKEEAARTIFENTGWDLDELRAAKGLPKHQSFVSRTLQHLKGSQPPTLESRE
jgi:hypothetical protein